jgi:ABC-type multidrug transport system fused ATPase/permease subunit
MKNFARLVWFAWPYRIRFGLSLACAALVALLWGANISAVYPLLKILFYESENCQKWIAQKLVTLEAEVQTIDVRLGEIDFIGRAGGPRSQVLRDHFQQTHEERKALQREVSERERNLDTSTLGIHDQRGAQQRAALDALRHDLQATEARLDELKRFSAQLSEDPRDVSLDARRGGLSKQRAEAATWIGRYRWLQPWADRYLPHEGFQTLLLLIGLVMTGVAIKGFFLFLQEVLVADVMQLTLFDIRNYFYRRTMALDLSSFGDSGSAELIARFTNDMDSLGQGLNTLMGKVIREPLRAPGDKLPQHRPLAELAAHLPGADPRAGLGADGQPRRPDHEARRPPLARKHVEYL